MQGSDLKLLAKCHHNPKARNKVIVQLMKKSKIFFHYDITDNTKTHVHTQMTPKIVSNMWKKAQLN